MLWIHDKWLLFPSNILMIDVILITHKAITQRFKQKSVAPNMFIVIVPQWFPTSNMSRFSCCYTGHNLNYVMNAIQPPHVINTVNTWYFVVNFLETTRNTYLIVHPWDWLLHQIYNISEALNSWDIHSGRVCSYVARAIGYNWRSYPTKIQGLIKVPIFPS